jgi:hypothetical protein
MGVRVRVKVHVQARWLLGKQAETPFRPGQSKPKERQTIREHKKEHGVRCRDIQRQRQAEREIDRERAPYRMSAL